MIQMNKKLLFNITEDWFFCSHFLDRAIAAKKAGYSIFVISRISLEKNTLDKYGIKFIPVPFDRKSINLLYEFNILIRIILIYKSKFLNRMSKRFFHWFSFRIFVIL